MFLTLFCNVGFEWDPHLQTPHRYIPTQLLHEQMAHITIKGGVFDSPQFLFEFTASEFENTVQI